MASESLNNYDAQIAAIPTPDLPSRVIKDRFITYRQKILAGVANGSIQQVPARRDNAAALMLGGEAHVYAYQNGNLQVQAIFREPGKLAPTLNILALSDTYASIAELTLNPEGGHDFDVCNIYGEADLITVRGQQWFNKLGPVFGHGMIARLPGSYGFAHISYLYDYDDERTAKITGTVPHTLTLIEPEGFEPISNEIGDGLHLRQAYVPENQVSTDNSITIEDSRDPRLLELLRSGWMPLGLGSLAKERQSKITMDIVDRDENETPYPFPIKGLHGSHIILRSHDFEVAIPGYPKAMTAEQSFTLDV